MTRQSANSDAAPRQASFTDVFVIFSVTVLSLAAGAGLLAQLGLAIWWAMVGALAIYAALLSLHLMARRQFAALDQAASERLQAEIDALMTGRQRAVASSSRRGFCDASRSADCCPATGSTSPLEHRSARDALGAGHTLPDPRDTGPVRFQAAARALAGVAGRRVPGAGAARIEPATERSDRARPSRR